MSGPRQVCTFLLGGLLFGVEVEAVQEVIHYQPVTRVPLSPPEVAGLMNLRGQIVTAIDLRRRLGLPPHASDELPTNLVIRTDGGPVSLLVGEIGEVTKVDEHRIEPVPDTVEQRARALMRGVYQLKDRLLLLLDSEKAVSVAGAGEAG